jgi:hypothetical protein
MNTGPSSHSNKTANEAAKVPSPAPHSHNIVVKNIQPAIQSRFMHLHRDDETVRAEATAIVPYDPPPTMEQIIQTMRYLLFL